MRRPATRTRRFGPAVVKAVTALMAVAVVGITAIPARADDDDWRRHERIERERHHRRPVHVAPAPAYVYAPPPVVYAPPPPTGINLIFPLNIR